MKRYHLTIAGGGATYTPGIVNAILNARDVLPLRKLVLLDNDAERVATMGGFIRLLLAEKAPRSSWSSPPIAAKPSPAWSSCSPRSAAAA